MFGSIIDHVTISDQNNPTILPFLQLPTDVLYLILDYATPTNGDGITLLSTTCKLFRRIIFRGIRDSSLLICEHLNLHSGYRLFKHVVVNTIHIQLTIPCITSDELICGGLIISSISNHTFTLRNEINIRCDTVIIDRCNGSFNISLGLFKYPPYRIVIRQRVYPSTKQLYIDKYGKNMIKSNKDIEYVEFSFSNIERDKDKLERLLSPYDQ